jgi:light-harvesting complex II chlorophyll a/b binding protein 6
MSIAARELEAGVVAPFSEGFDPLGLAKDKDFKTLKKWREAELKHGRVAMLAVLGTAVQENWHP